MAASYSAQTPLANGPYDSDIRFSAKTHGCWVPVWMQQLLLLTYLL